MEAHGGLVLEARSDCLIQFRKAATVGLSFHSFPPSGTHKMGILKHESADKGGNLLTSNQAIPMDLFDVTKAIPCPLKVRASLVTQKKEEEKCEKEN